MGNSESSCPACTLTDCAALKDRTCQEVGPAAVNKWMDEHLAEEKANAGQVAVDKWKTENLAAERTDAVEKWKTDSLVKERADAVEKWKNDNLVEEKADAGEAAVEKWKTDNLKGGNLNTDRADAVEQWKKEHAPPVPGYTMLGKSKCDDWANNYVACNSALDGSSCDIKATSLEECKEECDKRETCGEFYFKDEACYLANGNCAILSGAEDKDLQPHYRKNPSVRWRPIATSSYCHDMESHRVLTGEETVGWLEVDAPTRSGSTYEYLCKDKIEGCDVHKTNGGCLDANENHMAWRTDCVQTCGYCADPRHNKHAGITYEGCKQECESKGDQCVGIEWHPNRCAIISEWGDLRNTGEYFPPIVIYEKESTSRPETTYATYKSAMKLDVLRKDSEKDCKTTCDSTDGCWEYYYDSENNTCQLADGGCLDKTPVDDLNAFQYRCNDDKGDQITTFQMYDDDSLTDAQKTMIAKTYPGQPPSNYACKQGCVNPDQNCKVIGAAGRLGKPSVLEKTKHANLIHASTMKMVATANRGRKYVAANTLQLTTTFDGSCDIVETDAEAADLCARSLLCDGYWRYNNTTHPNRTCFKSGPRPDAWEPVPSRSWSGRYFPRQPHALTLNGAGR